MSVIFAHRKVGIRTKSKMTLSGLTRRGEDVVSRGNPRLSRVP